MQGESIQNASETGKRLIPVTEWRKYHPWPSEWGLRRLIFFEHTNGFHKVVVRVGRRVLIDEKAFFEWVSEQNTERGKK